MAVIDSSDGQMLKKMPFEIPGIVPETIQPVGVRVTSDGKKVYMAPGPSNPVALINGETDEVEEYLLVGQRFWQMAFTPDEKFILTRNGNSNDVSVIDVEDQKAIKSVQVGKQTSGVFVSPN